MDARPLFAYDATGEAAAAAWPTQNGCAMTRLDRFLARWKTDTLIDRLIIPPRQIYTGHDAILVTIARGRRRKAARLQQQRASILSGAGEIARRC